MLNTPDKASGWGIFQAVLSRVQEAQRVDKTTYTS